ncbi:MAG: hypothetical protein MJZ20_05105 [Bacteroidaceae bacterium]|nr:hypothetical protein [Bacteroidaceae bacterium]
MTKYTVDLQLNNGKSFKSIELVGTTADGMWQKFKLQDESFMRVPTSSIAYMVTVKVELLEDED